MQEIKRESIDAPGARTLVWLDGALYDVASGWRRIPVDGEGRRATIGAFGEQFDSVVTAPRGDVVGLVAGAGTKGLLLDPLGFVRREVDRSYYQAGAYRYPLALFTLPDGRTGLVHCPNKYNQLEIEVAATGERLTAAPAREPADVFHSRLAVSPSGRYLLSAGWFWHPADILTVFDVHHALADPATLDAVTDDLIVRDRFYTFEIGGACFVGDDIVVSSTGEELEDEFGPADLGPGSLARWSIAERRFTWQVRLGGPVGDLIPFSGHVLAVHHHPRLFDANTGALLAEWPDLPTGDAASSIVQQQTFSGPARIAVDGTRFAHTDGETVTVIDVG